MGGKHTSIEVVMARKPPLTLGDIFVPRASPTWRCVYLITVVTILELHFLEKKKQTIKKKTFTPNRNQTGNRYA